MNSLITLRNQLIENDFSRMNNLQPLSQLKIRYLFLQVQAVEKRPYLSTELPIYSVGEMLITAMFLTILSAKMKYSF